MVFELVGSMAIDPIARALNCDFPIGPVQVSPPSLDLYSPTPASLSLDAFASPVPTHTVLGSFGSSSIELPELIPNEPERYVHVGCVARASLVRHTPPPAAIVQSRQFPEHIPARSPAQSVVLPPHKPGA